MTLSQEEYANDDDSILLQNLKLQDWSEVSAILNNIDKTCATSANPDDFAVSRPDQYGNLPLHTAIGFSAPTDLILQILSLYPHASKVHGSNEWLPLHVAAMYSKSTEVLEALIHAYPEGLDDEGQGGVKGRTPRHFATRWNDEGKQLLLNNYVDRKY